MARGLRLSPSAAVTVTAGGALIRSDLGTLKLEGADIGAFVSRVLPLLDGTRTPEDVAAELPDYTRESVVGLLSTLTQRGVVEDATGDDTARAQDAWFARFTNPAAARSRIAAARVMVVGLEPWAVVVASELARAGVGTLQLLDDSAVRREDLLLADAWTEVDVGRRRADALRDRLERPGSEVSAGPIEALDASDWTLIVVTLAPDELHTIKKIARSAHHAGAVTLHAQLDGTDAVAGPLVFPGSTACWNCTRLRLLAHAEDPGTAHALQAALLAEPPGRRERTYPAPAAGLLGHVVALEGLRFLAGAGAAQLAGRQLVQSLVSLETKMHTVIRMPWCDVCGGAGGQSGPPGGAATIEAAAAPQSPHAAQELAGNGQAACSLAEAPSPEALRRDLAGWVDGRLGVIAHLNLDAPDAHTPELPFTATAVLARYTDGYPSHQEHELASGKGLTAVEALVGAAGEAVERYSAARYRRADLFRAPLDDMGGDVLDPRDLCLYSEAQYAAPDFRYDRFEPATALDWVRGRWLDDGAPVWVPALPSYYNFAAPSGERFCQVTSSGLAAGADEEDAALRATLEVIERDAFTLTWLARLPARRILADDALGAEPLEAARQLRQLGAELELWLLHAGIAIPTVACLAFGDGNRWPGMTVSVAAHPSPRVAARKALLEQCHVGPYIRRLAADPDRPVPRAADAVRSLIDHAMYYVPPSRRAAARFLDDGAEPIRLSELEEPSEPALSTCLAALEHGGVRVAIVDVTAPDVRASPFRVARALGPHLQPIHFGHGLERMANPRLAALLQDGMNAEPHPLA